MKNRKTVTVILILLLAAMLTAIITSTVRGFRSVELVFRETESIVNCGFVRSVALREDGTLVSTDDTDLSMFSDVVQIVPVGQYVAALCTDGTVMSDVPYQDEENPVYLWRNVRKIALDSWGNIVGILSDGSIVRGRIRGLYPDDGYDAPAPYVPAEEDGYLICREEELYDIVDVQIDWANMYFLRGDGKLILGLQDEFTLEPMGFYMLDVEPVQDFIPSDDGNVICLLTDGRVTVIGPDGTELSERLDSWQNVVQISGNGMGSLCGLLADGRVLVAGKVDAGSAKDPITPEESAAHAEHVASWRGIVEIRSTGRNVIALAADGRVYSAGWNEYGQCDVDDWRDVVGIYANGVCTYGICSDGTVLAVGDNSWGECNVSHWTDVRLPEGME